MLMAAILLLGPISYELLPVAALPNIDSPTLLVPKPHTGARRTRPGTVVWSVWIATRYATTPRGLCVEA